MKEDDKGVELHCKVVWNSEKSAYEAVCAELKDVSGTGETEAHALENLGQGVTAYLEVHSESLPFQKYEQIEFPEYLHVMRILSPVHGHFRFE